jgi:MFS family permease
MLEQQRLAMASGLEMYSLTLAYFGGLILTAIIGATILRKSLLKKQGLLLWNLYGVFACLISYIFSYQTDLLYQCILSFLISSSIGLGIPICLTLFSYKTKTENRGRYGALIFFIIQIVTAMIFFTLGETTRDIQSLGLAIWRLIGISGILFYSLPEIPNTQEKIREQERTIISIIKQKTFFLLFFAWFMFMLINFIEMPVVELCMGSEFDNYLIITNVFTSITAIGAGFLCDLKGRKIAGIVGFVFLGVGYAILSLFTGLIGHELTSYCFMIFDGVAWGILYVVFIFVIWGDLAETNNGQREKYYLLGGLPFLLSGLIQTLAQPYANYIYTSSISFSAASFFLFVSILPLLYAPESLSEKIMKKNDLNNYLQKAIQEANKKKPDAIENVFDQKTQSSQEAEESEKEDESYEEAKKIAEKYY